MSIHLRLFVAGDEPNSRRAKENLSNLCDEYLKGDCKIETIDILKDYQTAINDRIFVTPALKVEMTQKPTLTIYGNLSDEKKLLSALGVKS